MAIYQRHDPKTEQVWWQFGCDRCLARSYEDTRKDRLRHKLLAAGWQELSLNLPDRLVCVRCRVAASEPERL